MKYVVGISRILVGSLFIFSGIIKANDPLGFSYKLEEYWVEFGMGWDWLLSLSLPLAAGICVLEIALGVAVLVAYRMNVVSRLMLAMIVFFTALTFASAVFGLVRSCGCFGDAIPLTPWQSFIKDVILLVLIIIIFAFKRNIHPEQDRKNQMIFLIFPVIIIAVASYKINWVLPLYFTLIVLLPGFIVSLFKIRNTPLITTSIAAAGSLWLCVHCISHLPMKDFRPYAVGKSISEQMMLPEGAKADVYENIFKYKNLTTGNVEEFDESNYPWDDSNYVFVDRVTNLIEKGDEAKITDFSIVGSDGYNMTEDILNDPDPILLVISYNIIKADQNSNNEIKVLIDECQKSGISVIGLSASDESLLTEYTTKNQFNLSFYACDEITLKTMIRSNPGFVLLHTGVVKGQWHINDIPDVNEIKSVI